MGVSAQLYCTVGHDILRILYVCPLVLYHIKARTFASPHPISSVFKYMYYGPDHVQMTKVNWKNIQKYFRI